MISQKLIPVLTVILSRHRNPVSLYHPQPEQLDSQLSKTPFVAESFLPRATLLAVVPLINLWAALLVSLFPNFVSIFQLTTSSVGE